MKKIFINAYSEFNLGDDLFIKILCERYPNTLFYIYAPENYKVLFQDVKNLKVIPKNKLMIKAVNYLSRKLFKKKNFYKKKFIDKCDATLYIGGSLFIQESNWRKYLDSVKQMKVPNRPFFLLGANFGPYNNIEFYNESRKLFNEFEDICFRDEKSYDLFKDLTNVRKADDIVFQLAENNLVQQMSSKNIIISVIKPSFRKNLKGNDEIYYNKISDIASYFAENEYTVTLMSFCEFEEDNKAINEIRKKIPKHLTSKISNYYYKLNLTEALNLIENSSFIVGTRFHAMILGWVFNKPVYPIVYSEKMTNVMSDVGFKGNYTLFSDLENLDPYVVFQSMERNLLDISEQKLNSQNQFLKLDEFLNF